jgi:hypothetical protein
VVGKRSTIWHPPDGREDVAQHRPPNTTRPALSATYPIREFVEVRGLMSYGASITDAYRQSRPLCAGRIIKDAKLAELP